MPFCRKKTPKHLSPFINNFDLKKNDNHVNLSYSLETLIFVEFDSSNYLDRYGILQTSEP